MSRSLVGSSAQATHVIERVLPKPAFNVRLLLLFLLSMTHAAHPLAAAGREPATAERPESASAGSGAKSAVPEPTPVNLESRPTPETAFRELQDALKQKNWQKFAALLTDDSRALLAGNLAHVGDRIIAFAGENWEEIQNVLNKHRVRRSKSMDDQTDGDLRNEGQFISDQVGFISDAIRVIDTMTGRDANSPFQDWPHAELKDVEIIENSAIATVVSGTDAQKREEWLEFRKAGENWHVHLKSTRLRSLAGNKGQFSGGDVSFDPRSRSGLIRADETDQLMAPVASVVEGGYRKTLYLSYDRLMFRQSGHGEDSVPLYGVLELEGAPLEGATSFDALTLDPAFDDQGQLLARPRLEVPQRDVRKLDSTRSHSSSRTLHSPTDEPVAIPLQWIGPAANATRIGKIEGSVQILAGGEVKVLEFGDVQDKLGKELSDPVLKDEGVSIELTWDPPATGSKDRMFRVEANGARHKLIDTTFRSPNCERWRLDWTSETTSSMGMSTNERIGPKDKFVVRLLVGQKPVTVPFKFTNIPLPTNPQNESVEKATGEVRSTLKLFYERPEDAPFSFSNPLFATLELSCAELHGATRYGFVEITSAKCDTGESLALAEPIEERFGGKLERNYVPRSRFVGTHGDQLTLHLFLKRPTGKARMLSLLEGNFRIKTREAIVIPDVRKYIGKTLDDPRLLAHAEFQVDKPTDNDTFSGHAPQHGLVVQFQGPADLVDRMELSDGAGALIDGGASIRRIKDSSRFAFIQNDPLPENVQLTITLGGPERVISLPFKAENVPLPQR